PAIDPVLAAADAGDWAAYTQLQGGAMVQRKNLRVRVSYEEIQNQFEENVKKIKGVFSPIVGIASFICTRLIKWAIVSKNRRERAPRSSVNNCTACTVVKTSPLDDQREAIKKQLRIIGLPDDDFTVNRLFFRRSIQINHNQYLKLDNTLDGVHLIFSNSPSVPRKPQKPDVVLFDF
ncbi:hypothetical protein J3U35_03215, partial [Gilliamella sp. B2717]